MPTSKQFTRALQALALSTTCAMALIGIQPASAQQGFPDIEASIPAMNACQFPDIVKDVGPTKCWPQAVTLLQAIAKANGYSMNGHWGIGIVKLDSTKTTYSQMVLTPVPGVLAFKPDPNLSALTQPANNCSDVEQATGVSLTETTSSGASYSTTHGYSAEFSLEETVSVPVVGDVTADQSFTFSIDNTSETSTSQDVSIGFTGNMNIPAHTHLTVVMVPNTATTNMTWTANIYAAGKVTWVTGVGESGGNPALHSANWEDLVPNPNDRAFQVTGTYQGTAYQAPVSFVGQRPPTEAECRADTTMARGLRMEAVARRPAAEVAAEVASGRSQTVGKGMARLGRPTQTSPKAAPRQPKRELTNAEVVDVVQRTVKK